jgi:hypothetical protein
MDQLDVVIRRLDTIEAIKRLKARHHHAVDSKDWGHLEGVFTSDAVLLTRGQMVEGRETIVDWVRNALRGARTVHHCLMPELEVADAIAHGVWSMDDFVEWEDGTGFHGCGVYREEYIRTSNSWMIRRMELVRHRFDPLPGGLPPQFVLPPELAMRTQGPAPS